MKNVVELRQQLLKKKIFFEGFMLVVGVSFSFFN